MKIFISISKTESASIQVEEFERCKHFFVFDPLNDSEEVIENPFYTELGDPGIQSAYFIIELGTDVLITKKISKSTKRFLKSAKVKIFNSNTDNIFEAIKLFKENELLIAEKH